MGLDALCVGSVNHYFWCAECNRSTFASVFPRESYVEFVFSFPGSLDGSLFAIEPYDAKKHQDARVGFTPLTIWPRHGVPARLLRRDNNGLVGGTLYLCPDCVAKGDLRKQEDKFMERVRSLLMIEICELAWAGVLAPTGALDSLGLSEEEKQCRINSIQTVIEHFEAIDPEYTPYHPRFVSILQKCRKLLGGTSYHAKGPRTKEKEFQDRARSLLIEEVCELTWAGVLTPTGIPLYLRLFKKKRQPRIEKIQMVIDNVEAINPKDVPYHPKAISVLKECLALLKRAF